MLDSKSVLCKHAYLMLVKQMWMCIDPPEPKVPHLHEEYEKSCAQNPYAIQVAVKLASLSDIQVALSNTYRAVQGGHAHPSNGDAVFTSL